MSEELIGTVSHYFAKPQVGVVALTADIKMGEMLHFSGHGVDFRQAVTSMQVDHVPVETASSGTAVALKVEQRVREGTQVFRMTP
ncbi:MAG: translation elongation factor-like protein [Acidobacteria bacterium]|nr:translation elongation factor-like protein [Acidobacteriota bacterium]